MDEWAVRGSKVIVYTTENIFPWQSENRFVAKIMHTPQDVGDNYKFEVNGRTVKINPVSSSFIGYVYVKTNEELQNDFDF